MTETSLTRRRLIAASVGGAATAFVPPATAQTESHSPSGLWEDATFAEQAIGTGSFLRGLADRLQPTIPALEEQTIDDYVSATVSEFRDHTDDWRTWVNDRDLGGSERQTLEVNFQLGAERRTRYVNATWDGEDEKYTSIAVSETEHRPDITATVRNDAVRNAEEELRWLHEEYIVPNEDLEPRVVNYLAGRYYSVSGSHINASLLGGE